MLVMLPANTVIVLRLRGLNPQTPMNLHLSKLKALFGWAIVKEDQGSFLKLYLVRETKGQGTTNKADLRSTEMLKIDCGKAHFDELGVDFTWVSEAKQV